MKAFRGTLLATMALIAVAVVAWFFVERPNPDGVVSQPRLFVFEKHERARVEVRRPDEDPLVLSESEPLPPRSQWPRLEEDPDAEPTR